MTTMMLALQQAPEGATQLLNLGVGGLLAYMIVREVLLFLRTRKNGNGNGNGAASGEKPVDFWRTEIAAAVASSLTLRVIPLLEAIKSLTENDADQLRAQLTTVNAALTSLTISLEIVKSRIVP